MEVVALLMLIVGLAVAAVAVRRAIATLRAGEEADVALGDDQSLRRLADLAERKETILQLIRTARLDVEMGKISETEAGQTIAGLERDAVRVLKEMDRLRGTPDDIVSASSALDDVLRRVEAEREADRAGETWSEAALRRHGGRAPVPAQEVG